MIQDGREHLGDSVVRKSSNDLFNRSCQISRTFISLNVVKNTIQGIPKVMATLDMHKTPLLFTCRSDDE